MLYKISLSYSKVNCADVSDPDPDKVTDGSVVG